MSISLGDSSAIPPCRWVAAHDTHARRVLGNLGFSIDKHVVTGLSAPHGFVRRKSSPAARRSVCRLGMLSRSSPAPAAPQRRRPPCGEHGKQGLMSGFCVFITRGHCANPIQLLQRNLAGALPVQGVDMWEFASGTTSQRVGWQLPELGVHRTQGCRATPVQLLQRNLVMEWKAWLSWATSWMMSAQDCNTRTPLLRRDQGDAPPRSRDV